MAAAGQQDWQTAAPALLLELESLYESLVTKSGRERAALSAQVADLRSALEAASAKAAEQSLEAAERGAAQALSVAAQGAAGEAASVRAEAAAQLDALTRSHASQRAAWAREMDALRSDVDHEREAVATNASRRVDSLARERDAAVQALAVASAAAAEEMSALEKRLTQSTREAARTVDEALDALERERGVSTQLRRDLGLAARDQHHEPGLPRQTKVDRIIGRGVAGMQGGDHIDHVRQVAGMDRLRGTQVQKMHPLKTQSLR